MHQVFVVCLVFFAAKLTTIHGRSPDGFLFPVPEVVQVGENFSLRNLKMPMQFNPQTLLLETGLLACVVVVIVAQLTPQIIASVYPVRDYTFYSFLFVCSVEKFQTGLIETLLAQRRLALKTALFLYQ